MAEYTNRNPKEILEILKKEDPLSKKKIEVGFIRLGSRTLIPLTRSDLETLVQIQAPDNPQRPQDTIIYQKSVKYLERSPSGSYLGKRVARIKELIDLGLVTIGTRDDQDHYLVTNKAKVGKYYASIEDK